jgi:cytochrome c-type biogenesis protein CcmH
MIKKLRNYYQINKIFSLIIIIFLYGNTLGQISAQETYDEKKFVEISKMLRCMTCQNQTIYESETEFSKQIKKEILNQLKNKRSKAQIIDFMVQRYGSYILLKPQFNKRNLILWILPFLLLVLSFAIFANKLKKR